MDSKQRSQAFWVTYEPTEEEAFESVLDLIERVLPGKPGFWAGEVDVEDTMEDGNATETKSSRRVIDIVVCTGEPQRVASVTSPEKWRRRGARGSIRSTAWVTKGKKPAEQLHQWMMEVGGKKRVKQTGSEDELRRVLRLWREKEKDRIRKRRITGGAHRQRPGKTTGKGEVLVVDDSGLGDGRMTKTTWRDNALGAGNSPSLCRVVADEYCECFLSLVFVGERGRIGGRNKDGLMRIEQVL